MVNVGKYTIHGSYGVYLPTNENHTNQPFIVGKYTNLHGWYGLNGGGLGYTGFFSQNARRINSSLGIRWKLPKENGIVICKLVRKLGYTVTKN